MIYFMISTFLNYFRTFFRTGLVSLACLWLFSACSDISVANQNDTTDGNSRQKEHFKLQPFGNIPQSQVKLVAEALENYFNCDVKVQAAIDLPQSAWYAPRSRYRADSLLRVLHRNLEPEYDRAFGLTEKDISTTKPPHEDWGIMGLGSMPGSVCVVSTFRIKRGVNKAQFETRLKRVALHEVGHTMGLRHCENTKCLMRDANGKVATVDEEGDELCERCKVVVGKYLRID
jgi:archaemetzincin